MGGNGSVAARGGEKSPSEPSRATARPAGGSGCLVGDERESRGRGMRGFRSDVYVGLTAAAKTPNLALAMTTGRALRAAVGRARNCTCAIGRIIAGKKRQHGGFLDADASVNEASRDVNDPTDHRSDARMDQGTTGESQRGARAFARRRGGRQTPFTLSVGAGFSPDDIHRTDDGDARVRATRPTHDAYLGGLDNLGGGGDVHDGGHLD